ncbi:MAG: tetraacyldisaccharide 4'-kinase [SAR324 cluster bacterium]|nr:tetraacyldisaccharide 4'-kinase [SAR324 cluster bacterium]
MPFSSKWRFLLLPLALLYEALVRLRVFLYQKNLLTSWQPEVPVISVGNLSVGGAGKTPVVDYLLETLTHSKIKPVVLSRGYKRESTSEYERLRWDEGVPSSPGMIGDEPFLLATRHPEVAVYAGKNRVELSQIAVNRDHPDLLILDDGYQHLRLKRTLNLLLIDAERGLDNEWVIPMGPLREPVDHWKRADAIIVTKSNLGFSDRLLHVLTKKHGVTCPVFKFEYRAKNLHKLNGETLSMDNLNGKKIMVLSGVAQPQGVSRSLELWNCKVVQHDIFPDHHHYTFEDLARLQADYNRIHPDYWITTEKDAVKLRAYQTLHDKLWIMEMAVFADKSWEEFFVDFLKKCKLQ